LKNRVILNGDCNETAISGAVLQCAIITNHTLQTFKKLRHFKPLLRRNKNSYLTVPGIEHGINS